MQAIEYLQDRGLHVTQNNFIADPQAAATIAGQTMGKKEASDFMRQTNTGEVRIGVGRLGQNEEGQENDVISY